MRNDFVCTVQITSTVSCEGGVCTNLTTLTVAASGRGVVALTCGRPGNGTQSGALSQLGATGAVVASIAGPSLLYPKHNTSTRTTR